MNWKRFWVAAGVIYVVVQGLDLLMSQLFMKTAMESLKSLWRPNMMSRLWIMYVIGAMVAVLFVYIFVKGREGKGAAEGVRFGILIWLFVNVPMGAGLWVTFPIPYGVILRSLLIGLLEMLVAGVLVALIYEPKAPLPAAPKP